jgi:hypothetical protein
MFVRFLLSITPPLPPDAHAAVQAKGQQRHESFVEALGRRSCRGDRASRTADSTLGIFPLPKVVFPSCSCQDTGRRGTRAILRFLDFGC